MSLLDKKPLRLIKKNISTISLLIFILIPISIWAINDYQQEKYDISFYGYDSSSWEEINNYPADLSSTIKSEQKFLSNQGGTYDAARTMGIKDADWIENNSDGYKGIIHMVVNPHWDVDYGEEYSTNMGSCCNSILQCLEYCRLYPDFTFCLDAVLFVKAFWEGYPQYRNEFLQYLEEGRIEIVQGSISEFNCCGNDLESLVRNMIYGRNWVRETLGVESDIAWLTDCLDPITSSIGKLFAESGYKYIYSARDTCLGEDQAVNWHFDNGEELLFFKTTNYNNFPVQIEDFLLDFGLRLDNILSSGYSNVENLLYTLGLDQLAPIPWLDSMIDLWNANFANLSGYRMVWSTPTRFFTALENTPSTDNLDDLYIDTLDLDSRRSGDIASNANLKIACQTYEELLGKIETYGTFGSLVTESLENDQKYNYNEDLLESGWWITAMGQAHDTILGVVSKKGNDAVMGRYLQGLDQLQEELDNAQLAFVGQMNGVNLIPDAIISQLGGTSAVQTLLDNGELKALAIANQNAWNVTEPVQFGWNWTNSQKELQIFNSMGVSVPVQRVSYSNTSQFDVYNDAASGLKNGYLGYQPVNSPSDPNNREFQSYYDFESSDYSDFEENLDIFSPDWQEFDEYFTFIADLPSVGYSYYYICESEVQSAVPGDWDIPQGDLEELWISNEYYNLTFNEYGSVTSIVKSTQDTSYEEYIDSSNPIFDFWIQETEDDDKSKDASYDIKIDGEPVILSSEDSSVPTTIWIETGPVFSALHVSQLMFNTYYNRTFRLYSGIDFLHYGLTADINELDLEIEELDFHTLITDITFDSYNNEGYLADKMDMKLRSSYGRSTEKIIHNWGYFESENEGTILNNADQSVFISAKGPIGIHMIDSTDQLLVNHMYSRFIIRGEEPDADRVMTNNHTGYISDQINVFFGNGSIQVNRTQMTDLIGSAENMLYPLDVVGIFDCYINGTNAEMPTIDNNHSYINYNHTDTEYDSINGIISSIYHSTLDDGIIVRAWNPFTESTTLQVKISMPTYITELSVLDKYCSVTPMENIKENFTTSVSNSMLIEIPARSFQTGYGDYINDIDTLAPEISRYQIKGSFFDIGGSKIIIETVGNDVTEVHAAFMKDSVGETIDSDLIGYQEGSPLHSWVFNLDYYQKSDQWSVVSSSQVIESEIRNGINYTTWKIKIPWGYRAPLEMPGSIIPDVDGSLSLTAVRFAVFAEDGSGNIASMNNNSYLAGINENILIFFILPATIITLIYVIKLVKKKKNKSRNPTDFAENNENFVEEITKNSSENIDKNPSKPPVDNPKVPFIKTKPWIITKKVIWFVLELLYLGTAGYFLSYPLAEQYCNQIAQVDVESMIFIPILRDFLPRSFSGPQFVSPLISIIYIACCYIALMVHCFIFGKKKYRTPLYLIAIIMISNLVALGIFNDMLIENGGITTDSNLWYYFNEAGMFYSETNLTQLLSKLKFVCFVADPTRTIFILSMPYVALAGVILRKPFELLYRKIASLIFGTNDQQIQNDYIKNKEIQLKSKK